MKKNAYITPAAKEVNLLTMQMMAASNEIEVRTGEKGDQQLTNEWRNGWGDLWK